MSGVKVTNERPTQALADVESVDGVVDGEDVDWEPDTTTGIPPGDDPGDVLTWDGDSWEPEPSGSGMGIYYVVTDPTYGAVGDDTTDDTAAIQAAIDAAEAAGGGTVYFPGPGPYKITAPLVIDSSAIHLLGDGGAAARLNGGSTIRQATANTNGLQIVYPAYPVKIEGLCVKGPTGNSSGAGVSLNNGDIDTFDLFVSGFYNGLVHSADAYYSKHYHLRVYASDNIGVTLHGGDTNNCQFYGARISNCAIGLDVGGSLAVSVFGGAVEFNTTGGVRANGGGSNGAGLLLSGVYFEHTDGLWDVLLGNSAQMIAVTAEGCTFVKSSLSGTGWHIDGQDVTGLTVIGCELMSSDAIRAVGSSSGVVLMNNRNRNAGTITIPAGSVNVDTTSTTAAAVGTAAAGTSSKLARVDHVHEAAADDVTITDAGGYYTGSSVEAALQEIGSGATASDVDGLILVDPGANSVDTGSPPGVTVTTKWGIDTGMPYYDSVGADAGEEAALFWDPVTDHYVLIPYGF